jgi:PiT family inorganic phosphate transporter
MAECRVHGAGGLRLTITLAHWLTSRLTSLVRGLNDAPKIVAIGAFGLVPNGSDPGWLVGAVAAAMTIGGVGAGRRVARSLGARVVRMDRAEGFRANLATAALVGLGRTWDCQCPPRTSRRAPSLEWRAGVLAA